MAYWRAVNPLFLVRVRVSEPKHKEDDMRLVRRPLARFDAWVDGLDVYAPGSRVHEHRRDDAGLPV